MKKDHEVAQEMADYIRTHGFSPFYTEPRVGPGCGCFMRAYREVTKTCHVLPRSAWKGNPVERTLRSVVSGISLQEYDFAWPEYYLRTHGWDTEHAEDAATACEIAAALLKSKEVV